MVSWIMQDWGSSDAVAGGDGQLGAGVAGVGGGELAERDQPEHDHHAAVRALHQPDQVGSGAAVGITCGSNPPTCTVSRSGKRS